VALDGHVVLVTYIVRIQYIFNFHLVLIFTLALFSNCCQAEHIAGVV